MLSNPGSACTPPHQVVQGEVVQDGLHHGFHLQVGLIIDRFIVIFFFFNRNIFIEKYIKMGLLCVCVAAARASPNLQAVERGAVARVPDPKVLNLRDALPVV